MRNSFAAFQGAAAEIDLLITAFTDMFLFELVGKYLGFLSAVWTLTGK